MSDIRDDDYLRYAQALSYECLLGEIQSVRKALYGSVEGRERMRYLRRFIALVELLRSTKPPAPPVQPNGEWIQSWPNEPSLRELDDQLNQLNYLRSHGRITRESYRASQAAVRELKSTRLEAMHRMPREEFAARARWLIYKKEFKDWKNEIARRERNCADLSAECDLLLKSASTAKLDLYEQVWWEILPPDHQSFSALVSSFDDYRKTHASLRFEPERLHYLINLKPTRAFRGLGEWNDYRVYEFADPGYSVFESPFYGNATYVVKSLYWQRCSCLSKSRLQTLKECEARLIHGDQWRDNIRAILGLPLEWEETLGAYLDSRRQKRQASDCR